MSAKKGLRLGLESAGCELLSEDGFRSAITPEGCASALAQLLDGGRLPDAVVAYNDVVALGIYDGLRRRGLEAGRDIAVASFDDTRIAASQVPPMTSVAGFPGQLGATAARLLIDRLARAQDDAGKDEASEPVFTLIDPQLKVRSSTAGWRPRQTSRGH